MEWRKLCVGLWLADEWEHLTHQWGVTVWVVIVSTGCFRWLEEERSTPNTTRHTSDKCAWFRWVHRSNMFPNRGAVEDATVPLSLLV